MVRFTVVLLLMHFAYLPTAQAQQLPLEKCQYLQDKIETYTKLRRQGGSASRMESLKNSRKRYEARFSDADCYRYGAQLK